MRSIVIEISQSCGTGEILLLKNAFWAYQQGGQPRRGLSGSTTSISTRRPTIPTQNASTNIQKENIQTRI